MNIISQQGFTLIELMVTLAVLAILSTVAVPAFNTMLTQQQLNKSARDLALTLSDARAKAALERREVKVELNSSAVNTNTQFNWMPSGEAILSSTSPTTVTFLPIGVVQGGAAVTFEVCSSSTSGVSRIITIGRMGNLQPITEGTC